MNGAGRFFWSVRTTHHEYSLHTTNKYIHFSQHYQIRHNNIHSLVQLKTCKAIYNMRKKEKNIDTGTIDRFEPIPFRKIVAILQIEKISTAIWHTQTLWKKAGTRYTSLTRTQHHQLSLGERSRIYSNVLYCSVENGAGPTKNSTAKCLRVCLQSHNDYTVRVFIQNSIFLKRSSEFSSNGSESE